MKFAFSLLFLILSIYSIRLTAQGKSDQFLLYEEIYVHKVFDSPSKLYHVLIDSLPFRQNMVKRSYSIKPHSYQIINGKKYAVWDIAPLTNIFNIEVITTIELLDFDLNHVMQTDEKDLAFDTSSNYLERGKFLQIDNKKLKETAVSLISSNEFETAKNIFEFVVENIEYKFFSYQERGAKRALKTGLGDCTEYSELFIALCRANQIPARYAVGLTTRKNNDVGFHNWAEVFIVEYGWIPVDPTWADSDNPNDTFENLTNRRIYLAHERSVKRTFVETAAGDQFFPEVLRKQKDLYSIAVRLYRENNLIDAIHFLNLLIQNDPSNPNYFNYKGMALARLGQYDEALANLQQCLQLSSDSNKYFALYSFANFFALKGDKEKCISYLKASIEEGYTNFEHMKTDEDLKLVWEDEAFKELLDASPSKNK